ncbi:hypothetical protein NDU88_003400 [Pleurodeles waltl]|uniref:Uncharacterized protein n=1 Tax=Pleurodeles waltl TaxID=8319 RepID=A0AAV7W211_PLEWA|nr:hypothetical protein NDU88_003400 [Pleurodeles waltl]
MAVEATEAESLISESIRMKEEQRTPRGDHIRVKYTRRLAKDCDVPSPWKRGRTHIVRPQPSVTEILANTRAASDTPVAI